ncbi:sensor histidine kinase [Actinokineospora sp. UTMC 2448]|uniref:sensor histidine kinase n=1 Tax=Actinokineospora sp. UTMC 2448 TaxID=2268449 RepID=UPI002164D71F|nr:ATP-binding protein [Actinokineospora sp. UTMC 2448]UVS78731.1 Sensor histidine kinase LiaS [Actinokineospora sp. UTMC 2448]
MGHADAGDATEVEVRRRGRRYAVTVRTVVLACAAAVAVYQTPVPLVVGVAVALIGWSAVFLVIGPRAWVVAVDTGVVVALCLAQRWTVPPEALSDSTNWVLAVVSITAVAHQWHTGTAAGATVTGVVLAAYLAGNFLADPAVLPVSAPLALWTLGEAGLSRGLFLLLRTGAQAADQELAVSERARRDAAVAAARRADEREHLALLHDTAASTLLAVGMGAADAPWLRERARQDLAVLRDRPAPVAAVADLVELLAPVVRQSPVDVETRAPASVPLPAEVATAIRGAVREALANVARHAGVDTAVLTVDHADGRVAVEIADAGRGFRPDLVSPHRRGVASSIVRRIDHVGGRAAVETAPGAGTRVRLEWSP